MRRTRPSTGQEQLDFLPPAPPKPKTLGTTVEATIWCDYPVATQMHRAIAMAVDWSMVMIGYALCLAVYKLLGGSFVLNKPGLIATGGMLAVVATAYFLIWAIMNTETAGMRSMQLELVTFDGSPLEPSQRWLRYFGSCLSSLTLLGHIWSLLDEEGLAWQDHMSRTFPRPLGARAQVFRRK